LLFFYREKLDLSLETQKLGNEYDFEVKGYVFRARKEDVRKPRLVRVCNKLLQIHKLRPMSDFLTLSSGRSRSKLNRSSNHGTNS
jgi:hypothetical protein